MSGGLGWFMFMGGLFIFEGVMLVVMFVGFMLFFMEVGFCGLGWFMNWLLYVWVGFIWKEE